MGSIFLRKATFISFRGLNFTDVHDRAHYHAYNFRTSCVYLT